MSLLRCIISFSRRFRQDNVSVLHVVHTKNTPGKTEIKGCQIITIINKHIKIIVMTVIHKYNKILKLD